MSVEIVMGIGAESNETKYPLMAECRDCKHTWAACYLPMTLAKAAKVLHKIRCRLCAGDKIFCLPTDEQSSPAAVQTSKDQEQR